MSNGLIKADKGSLTSMKGHFASHEKDGFVSNMNDLKKWLVASLRCTRNIPSNVFNCGEMKMLFPMSSLGSINADIVRRFCDEEAT